MKNSKKGFSLPMAIAVSLFLIIISSSLLFISIQSMSTTSVDISGRQAYLNVKSALDYARSYYSTNVTDYSKVGTEYIIMNDEGGTTEAGAKVEKSADSAKNATTYVMAVYKKGEGSNKSTLTLTAFSKYSDAYGNKSKLARLSVTYTVGGSGPNRLTIIGGTPKGESTGGSDSITLNVKKPKSMDSMMLTYYIWTYKDPQKAYQGFYNTDNTISSFDWDKQVIKANGWIGRLNAATTGDQKVEPNDPWGTGNTADKTQNGPQGVFADTGNGWFVGEFFPKNNYVPWFNVIFAQQGSVLAGDKGPNNIYDSQVNEIFHLWYLDPTDKNIYFEFKGDQKTEIGNRGDYYEQYGKKFYTKYYEKGDWDGKQGLDDTVVVYVKNPKTTIHLRIKDTDDLNDVTTLAPSLYPKIKKVTNKDNSSISGRSYMGSGTRQSENIPMEYEGCGWWVANVETNRTFDITFVYSGGEHKAYSIEANSASNEFWFVENDGLDPHMTEESALRDLGVDPGSYVTIKAKSSEYASKPSPKLIYANPGIESTTDREELQRTVQRASQLVASRYEANSYKKVKQAVAAARTILNQEDYIDKQPYATAEEKINAANAVFKQKKQDIEDAIAALKNVETTLGDMTSLVSLVNQGKYAKKLQEQNGEYDKNAYATFISEGSSFNKAVAAVNNPKSVTLDEVSALETALNNDLTTLRAARLDRDTLSTRIQSYSHLENLSGVYEAEFQNAFNTAIADARTALAVKDTSQGALDIALNALEDAKKGLDEHAISVLNFERLNELKALANIYLGAATKENCTDDSYDALSDAMDAALNEAPQKTKQSEIEEIADKLEAAIKGFYVKKPAGSIDELKANNSMRVWVINECADPAVSYNLNKYAPEATSATIDDINTMKIWGPAKGATWRYIDVGLSDCEKVNVTTKKDGVETGASPFVSLATVEDYNLCFVITETGDITITKLITVYGDFDGDKEVKGKIGMTTNASSFDSPYYCFRYYVTDSNKNDQFNVVNIFNSLDPDEPAPYDVYNAGKIETPGEYVIIHTIDEERHTTATLVSVDKIYPKFSEAPAAPDEPVTPTDPEPAPAVAKEGDVEIGGVIHTQRDYIYFTDNPNQGGQWASGGAKIYCYFWGSGSFPAWPGTEMSKYKTNDSGQQMYKIIMPEGAEHCIFSNGSSQTHNIDISDATRGTGFYKTGWSWDYSDSKNKMNVGTWSETNWIESYKNYAPFETGVIYITNKNTDWKSLQVYFWGGEKEAPFPGFYLDYDHTEGSDVVYKITPPKGSTNFLVSNGNDTQQSISGFIVLGHHYVVETTNNGAFKNLVDKDASTSTPSDPSGGGGTYDAPGYNEANLAGTNGEMRYVGGNRVRIINESYSDKDLFGNNAKKNEDWKDINSGNPYGGYGMNNDSGGRLGHAKLIPYYDWFERKIPVSEMASYDFTIEGLSTKSGKTNVQTKIVEKARGNVWVELLSTNNSGGGHFQNYNIYTFDPEEKQIGESLNVYFRLPYVDTEKHPDYVTWHDPQIILDGPFVDTLTDEEKDPVFKEHLTRTGNLNIWVKKNIKKNNPFITFTVVGPDRDDPTKSKTYSYRTCFQGGDYVLFDPSLNDYDGGWEEFVSDQERLKRAVNLLRSTYYGCRIVSGYDDKGVQRSDAFFTYSTGLLNKYSNYATTKTTDGCTFYVTKNYDSENDTWCYNEANSINSYLAAARNLYAVMNECKQYIAAPLTSSYNSYHGSAGGVYPEYYSRTVKNRKYKTASIDSLKLKLSSAEKTYAGDSTANAMNEAANMIKGAVSSLEVDSEGSIAMVFFDCKNKVEKGSKFQIRFTLTQNSINYTVKDVDEYNPEKYPIYFLSPDGSNTYDEIFNVQFIETDKDNNVIEHKAYPSMKMNEAWVYLDQEGNPRWSRNSASDYREINADIFQMANASDSQEYKAKKIVKNSATGKWECEAMTLLFTKDAEVIPAEGASFEKYVIKAGSYFIDSENCEKFDDPGVVELYSAKAEAFFTDPENIGYYVTGGKDLNDNTVGAVSTGSDWIDLDHNDFQTGATSINGYVNFAAKEGSFTKFTPYYGLEASDGIFFRWETTSPLYLSSTVKLIGSEFKFANMGVLDGTQTRTPHFYLISSDASLTSMYVEFRTDFYVKYVDKKGVKHQFAIREGKYEIRKPKKDSNRSYFADLFDETYWKGMEDITFIGRGTVNEAGSGSTGELVEGTFSN